MPVKVRPQKRIAAATIKFSAPISLTRGWDCQFSTCPSGQVPFTTSNVPLTEVFNSTS